MLFFPPALEAQADRIVREGGKVLFAPSQGMGPCYDAQNFFDVQGESSGSWRGLNEWLSGRYTTSAAPVKTFAREDYERAREAMRNLGPVPDRVEFFEVPDSTDLAVKMNGDFIGFITAEQFEELKAKLEAP